MIEPAADAQEEQEAAEVAEPAPTATNERPVEQQPVDQQSADEQPVDEEPAEGRPAAAPDAEQEAGEPSTLPDAAPAPLEQADDRAAGATREPDNGQARRLLGFGILALTLLLAIVAAWRLPMRRDVSVEDPGVWGTPATFADTNGSTNGRGEARGPAVSAYAGPAPNPANPRGHPFANRPYVDRTAMVVGAGAGPRGAPLRRPLATTRRSRKKGRSAVPRNPARLFFGGVPRNGGGR